jgi:hypothetical protein
VSNTVSIFSPEDGGSMLFETLVFTSTHTQLNPEDQHGNFTTVRNLKYYFMPFQEGSVCKDIIFNTPSKRS